MESLLVIRPKSFAATAPILVFNGWVPSPPQIVARDPITADVIAAPLPMLGGMRIVAYNRGDERATVTLRYE